MITSILKQLSFCICICIQDFLITLYYLIPANYQLRLNFGAKKELLKGDYQRIQLCRPSRWP